MSVIKVSALMPTYNRREFISQSISCFLEQQYPANWDVELIVLDDGTDPIKDLIPSDSRIKYFYETPKSTHGSKMNRCFELSIGEYGLTWDDDDRYSVDRIARQIWPLIVNPELSISGTSTLYYYIHGTQKAYCYRGNGRWLGAIALRRSTWEKIKFDTDKGSGADNRLLQKIPRSAWYDVKDPNLVIAAIHPNNDCRKNITSDYVEVDLGERLNFCNNV